MEAAGIEERCDVLIAGCGVGGLFAALSLPESLRVLMLSKGPFDECDSMLAQGGVCVMADDDDFDAFFEDTMRAGRHANDPESVRIMVRESREIIGTLLELGVRFERDQNGALSYTREAAHSRARICHCEDITGREVTTRLFEAVRRRSNVRMVEHAELLDLAVEGGVCRGAAVRGADGHVRALGARWVVLATGGIGGLYACSTNYPVLTGDGCRIAERHGVALRDMDCVQIHPTSLYTGRPGRAFLISESARGEGAVLLDARGERFTDELAPRDVVTEAILRKMEAEGSAFVRLSFEGKDPAWVRGRFPNIYARCLEEGYDITRVPVPVAPAQHYLMGGVAVDHDSRTNMPGLFAVGETSCNGVHGKNRLASNSLLESMVFARRAARAIAGEMREAR